jgi:hypothetical protein
MDDMTPGTVIALRDIANFPIHHPYTWKPKHMEMLVTRGLVERHGEHKGKVTYRITQAGREAISILETKKPRSEDRGLDVSL